ncbi:MAG: pitrilysin family protein, partial [Candidatus Brocadiaceae bacterium]
GTPRILQGFDRDLVQAHYRRFFAPRNMVVCLAGGFDFDGVLAEVERLFGQMKSAGPVPELVPPAVQHKRARSIYRRTEALPVVEALFCHHAYPLGDERFDALRAVGRLLGGGLTSRLFNRVREELGLVYDVGSYVHAFSDVGASCISMSVGVENLIAALEAVLQVVGEAVGEGFTEEELNRYKESARCGMDMLCDHPGRLADWIGKQELFLGADRVITPQQYVSRQEALSLSDLRQVAEEIFVESAANLAVAGPFEEEQRRRMRGIFPAEEVPEPSRPAEARTV